jgi:hypothetical protein
MISYTGVEHLELTNTTDKLIPIDKKKSFEAN